MIELQDVNKIIKNKMILENINVKFQEAKIYLVEGPNGCGKTMLLRAICGLIKPTSGRIEINGSSLFGVILEKPSFMDNESGIENLRYLALIRGKITEHTIEKWMKRLNLFEVRNNKVKTYSLGMKQRLAICQAMMESPDILLLDEPFNAIDDENVKVVLNLILEMKKEGAITIIVSHGILEERREIFDKTFCMRNGQLISNDL